MILRVVVSLVLQSIRVASAFSLWTPCGRSLAPELKRVGDPDLVTPGVMRRMELSPRPRGAEQHE